MVQHRDQPPRRSQAETRAALVAAGRRLLVARGVGAGLDRVTLNDAVLDADVPRASAYRAFDHERLDPQEAFRLAVVIELIESTEPDVVSIEDLIELLGPGPMKTDPQTMAASLRELIRLGMAANLDANLADENIRAIDAVALVTALDPDPDPDMVATIATSYQQSIQRFLPLYRTVAHRFGLRPAAGSTYDSIASLLAACTTVAMAWSTLQPETRVTRRPTGPDGADQEWSLNGVLAEGVALTTFEPDPEAEVCADLASWNRW